MNTPLRKLLAAKIHRATVTGADVDYEGSVTIPPALLEASGILAYESVHIWNTSRGTRLRPMLFRVKWDQMISVLTEQLLTSSDPEIKLSSQLLLWFRKKKQKNIDRG